MKIFIVALLFAISYAQTGDAAAGAGGLPGMMYGMYEDFGDMYDYGDLFDNLGYMMGGGAGGAQGAQGFGQALSGLGNNIAMMGGYGDVNDMISDVYDNMKDGDIYDVMENALPLAQMGVPGFDLSSLMQGGMPDLAGLMQGIAPGISQYLAMDGDFPYDMGDMYKYGSDMYEDMMKYGGMGGMMGGMGGNPMLRKNRVKRRHRPSRLLKKQQAKKHLRHKREFPFFALQQTGGADSTGARSTSPFPFMFDTPDSEDLAAFLMMGGNRNAIPPPVDGIDTEDFWMYQGTKWDPMKIFNQATASTTTTNADGTTTQTAANPWLYALLSSLQKAHMQRKN